jgi:cell division septation protein DedD
LFRKISSNGALAGREAIYVPAGKVTRLQVGPFASRTEADAACRALKGQACFSVPEK